jgi:hypothetical protein
MLNFLKFNIGMSDPEMTVDHSAVQQSEYLEETESRVDTRVPRVIQDWIKLILGPSLSPLERFLSVAYEPDTPFSRMLKALDSSDNFSYDSYRAKWRRYLLKFHRLSEQECRTLIDHRIPTPEVYKDYHEEECQTSGMSDTLDNDYWGLCHIINQHYGPIRPGLSEESLDYIKSYLNQSPNSFNLWEDGFGPWYPDNPRELSIGTVGQVHHIPKKGTTVRRPIAVPNRFIQAGLAPAQQQLYAMLKNLPCDCTFDQNLFDAKIQNRVNNSSLYVASVDLSKATDNLPRAWGEYLVNKIFCDPRSHCCETVKQSFQLFWEVAGGMWDNNGWPTCWPVGQPLGSLPSFGVLAITHNLLLESLSLSIGLCHSPYCILGDDLLVFNKKLRSHYIQLMEDKGIPLSLHKSYSGELVEFAGKTYIRNQLPFYTSDQGVLTWNSLFDYQRATGIPIPWEHLPKSIQRRFSAECTKLTEMSSKCVYNTILDYYIRCIEHPNILLDIDDRCAAFYVWIILHNEEKEEDIPQPRSTSGIVSISGHPVTFGDYGYANKDGHQLRYRKVLLPQWYKDKYRPCSTSLLIKAATNAMSVVL